MKSPTWTHTISTQRMPGAASAPLSLAAEASILFRLAVPTFVSSLSFTALSMIEMILAGHLGTSEMTAVAFSQIIFDFTSTAFTQGFNKGLSAVGSQAYGAKNYVLLGRCAQMGCVGLTVAAVPLGVCWWFVGDLLGAFGVSAASVVLAKQYARLSVLSLWPRLMYQYLCVYFEAQQIVLPAAIISLSFVPIHVAINLLFVYGIPAWHVPGLGFVGLPLALACTAYTRLAVFLVYMMGYKRLHARSWHWTLDFLKTRYIAGQIRIGLPLALGQLFEDAQLQTMALLASTVNEISLDSHNSMLGLIFFLSSPIYGLESAGITRIGMYLGAGRPRQAKRLAKLLTLCICGLAAIIATVLMLNRHVVGQLYSVDPLVWVAMTQICTLAASGYVFLCVFYSSMAILVAQTRASPILCAFLWYIWRFTCVLVAFFIGAWLVGVPAAYVIGIVYKMGLLGIWIGMSLGYGITSLVSLRAATLSNWHDEAEKAVDRSKHKDDHKTTTDETSLL
ncbi:Aste57867_8550 [Aphanomyces stellatus]|uniref:Aste57867_8550 protein n=1 Tax=Aphanomyces stellatus TaxID=120398 RepID=A0A485KKJ9_9STRA|nr:hypothetical protein As57867_008518 [Aphanomyces stellatus]VFT85436.1 Aste57867_8550 [Aphanomyces stellatus]